MFSAVAAALQMGRRQESWRTKEADRVNDVPETTFEEIKLSPKKASCARITSAGLSDIAQCAEGEQLKQQYDSTLQEWRRQSQPQVRPFVEGEALARRAFQLREEALTEMNAAANRMYLHRAGCAICRRRR
jgi:hypothetical protein